MSDIQEAIICEHLDMRAFRIWWVMQSIAQRHGYCGFPQFGYTVPRKAVQAYSKERVLAIIHCHQRSASAVNGQGKG